jgi:two-component system, response regulator
MILVIEDDAVDQTVIHRIVRSELPEVSFVVARDGAEAIEVLRDPAVKERVRLVLLDMQLPKLSGLEVLETLGGHNALVGVPIVAISASENPEFVKRAYELGARSFLTKPTDYAEYSTMVRHAAVYWLRMNLSVHSSKIAAQRSW